MLLLSGTIELDGTVEFDPSYFIKNGIIKDYGEGDYSVNILDENGLEITTASFDTGYWTWKTIEESGKIRPINNVKIYGADNSPGTASQLSR